MSVLNTSGSWCETFGTCTMGLWFPADTVPRGSQTEGSRTPGRWQLGLVCPLHQEFLLLLCLPLCATKPAQGVPEAWAGHGVSPL